ncbi:MAG: MFS transporter [Gammaproteobacteria bacterium]|nr:MFS transporter [Gammaproteobacteria bacterium]
MPPHLAIAAIVLAELFGTSLWFSINAVAGDIVPGSALGANAIGHLTSAVQLGFISGTLVFALTGLADRYAASHLFATCAVLGAATNALFTAAHDSAALALTLRFATGFLLAGIYPIGMKLVIGWAPERAGQMLGWLVGMLALGTGLPHLVRGTAISPEWTAVLYTSSALAVVAGLMVYLLGDGPHHGRRARLHWGPAVHAFRHARFRAAAMGYFGHMWELYAFWAMVPFLVLAVDDGVSPTTRSLIAFAVFVCGGLGCVVGGYASRRVGNAAVAGFALAGSALMCLVFPLASGFTAWLAVPALLLWGALVVTDSPQFSAMAAGACRPEDVGSALAMMNSIGFAISICSIELSIALLPALGSKVAWILLPGPVFGLWAMRRLLRPAVS